MSKIVSSNISRKVSWKKHFEAAFCKRAKPQTVGYRRKALKINHRAGTYFWVTYKSLFHSIPQRCPYMLLSCLMESMK